MIRYESTRQELRGVKMNQGKESCIECNGNISNMCSSPLSTDPTATEGAAGKPPVPKKSSNTFFFALYSPQNTGNILSIMPSP